VVEDDAAILTLVQTILEDAGFEVPVASSAENTIRVESVFSRTIHPLLSDVMMPDMCGPDLAKVLKQRRPEMRVMLMSGYADGAMRRRRGALYKEWPVSCSGAVAGLMSHQRRRI
jgi:two-component system cell cycle sensor histidine kinase/response regulator CckA